MATDSSGSSATGSGARRSVREDGPRLSAARSTLRFVATFAISHPFRYALERIVQQSRCDVLPRYLYRIKARATVARFNCFPFRHTIDIKYNSG
jgi:hypothetical protein